MLKDEPQGSPFWKQYNEFKENVIAYGNLRSQCAIFNVYFKNDTTDLEGHIQGWHSCHL
jgi:hypothetical protein